MKQELWWKDSALHYRCLCYSIVILDPVDLRRLSLVNGKFLWSGSVWGRLNESARSK